MTAQNEIPATHTDENMDGVCDICKEVLEGHIHTPGAEATCTTAQTCKKCKTAERIGDYVMPIGHDWDENHVCKRENCGVRGKSIAKATVNFGTIDDPRTATTIPRYFYQTGGVRPNFYVTMDGETALTWSSDANVNADHSMKDLFVSWNNDEGIGHVVMTIEGKGNYYGTRTLEYYIIPRNPTNLVTSNVTSTSVKLSWSAGLGADSYRVYMVNGDKDIPMGNTTGTSFTVTGLTGGTEYTFRVDATAISTDGKNVVYAGKTFPGDAAAIVDVQTSADALEIAEVKGDQITVSFNGLPKTDGSWNVIIGSYDTNGKMLHVAMAPVTGKSIVLTLKGASAAKVISAYVLDTEGIPVMEKAIR